MKPEAYRTEMRRGQLWWAHPPWAENEKLVLVISSDDWNCRDVEECAVVYLYRGDPASSPKNHEIPVHLDGELYYISMDYLEPLRRDRFESDYWASLPKATMDDVDSRLQEMLNGNSGRQDPRKPTNLPRQGGVRYIGFELDIREDGHKKYDKVGVIVSSDSFTKAHDYKLALACRIPSTARQLAGLYNIRITDDTGTVSCSSIMTVRIEDISRRSPKKTMLTNDEKVALHAGLRRFLGI